LTTTPDQTPGAGIEPPAPRARRRKRDVIGLIAGVATAACVVIGVIGAAVVLLFASGFVPLAGLQRQVESNLANRLGPGWAVTAAKAGIVRDDGRPTLQIVNAEFAHASGLRMRAPETKIRFNPFAVLRGEFSPTGIELVGVSLRLRVDGSGALALDTGESELRLNEAPDRPSDEPLIGRVIGVAAAALSPEGAFPQIESLSLTQSRLTLVAPDGSERIGLQDVAARLEGPAERRSFTIKGASPSGSNEITLTREAAPGREPSVTISTNAFRLDDLEALFVGRGRTMSRGLPLTGQVRLGGPGLNTMAGEIEVGSGVLTAAEGSSGAFRIDGLSVAFTGPSTLESVDFTRLNVRAGATALEGAARLAHQATDWRVGGRWSGRIAGEGADPPQTVTELALDLGGVGAESLHLREARLRGPELDASASGRVARAGDGVEIEADIRSGRSPFRAVLTAWPAIASPMVRELLVSRVRSGIVEQFSLALRMDAAAIAAARSGEAIPDASVRAEVKAAGVRFVLGAGLPDLQDASLSALSTGRTLALQSPTARVDLGAGRALALSDGTFAISDTYAQRPIGRASFRTTGGADALAALLAQPAVRDAAPAQIPPDAVRGRVDLRSTLSLPLVETIKASDVVLQSSGQISGLASDKLFGDLTLEGANLAASYDRGNLTLKGEGRINGSPSTIDVKQDARAVGEAVVSLTLDAAARKNFGVTLPSGVSGSIGVRAVQPFGRDKAMPTRIEADLTRAAIDGLLPGWSKPAGRAARAAFSMSDNDAGGVDLADFVLEAAPVAVRGRLSLTEDGGLQSATLSQFRLSPGDDARVDLRREGSVVRVNVRGQVFDARPFLRQMGGGPARRPSEAPQDVDLDLALPILTGFNNEVIGGAALKMSRRGVDIRQFDLGGRIGRSPLSIQQTREGQKTRIVVRAEDGGGLLRFVDIYRRAFGGELIVSAQPDGERITGEVLYRDFRVRNEPALRRVLSEQFAQQQGSDRVASGRDAGNDVAFTKLRAGFTRTPSRVDIREGVIWGNEIGLTGQGSIDYARDRIDVAGTFIPGYALNNVFSQVPVIGRILGGGQYEGLFAVNFRLSGAASAPSMTINPLSAIAPGIFRRFVDPFGGVPTGDLRGAPPGANPDR
jgi:hypothetical protein